MMKENIIFFYSKNHTVFLATHSRQTIVLKVNKIQYYKNNKNYRMEKFHVEADLKD